MKNLNLAKKYKTYYSAKQKPELVEIEAAQYISICGKGDPSSEEFAENIEALYNVAYSIRAACKAEGNKFTVAKLEGLWWFNEEKYNSLNMVDEPEEVPRSEWEYRLLIRMPVYVKPDQLETAIKQVVKKKQLKWANKIEWYQMEEGKTVQMLHVGPFDKEPETLEEMNTFIKTNKLDRNGLHHEIYLSDFRRTAPEKLKTILREPVK